MLPSAKLISCEAAHLWQDDELTGAIYPSQVRLDHFDKNGCPHGLVALYDKTIPLKDVKRALDLRYAKWSKVGNDNGQVYRVEPEGLAIQLATIQGKAGTVGERGTKELIYLRFDVAQAN